MGGTLERKADGHRVALRLHHVIGRAASCHLRLARSEASGLHAALQWSARGWEVRDLGSTNGTLLDGRRIAPGQWQPVTVGAELAFGHPEAAWVLVEDGAPVARAFPTDGGPPVEARGGLLSLPGPDDAELLVARGPDGRWMVEDEAGAVASVGDAVRAGGRTWTLELPEADPRTPLAELVRLPQLRLRFAVSADEEFVTLRVVVGGVEHDLGARAHHYLLLTLARLRQRDAEADPGADAEHGWVGIPQLTRMLRLEERPLNLQIFRIRRQFADLGVAHLPEVVERRRGTGQLRLGEAIVEVEQLV